MSEQPSPDVRSLPERLRFWDGEYKSPNGLMVEAADEIDRLNRLINTPHTHDFIEAVKLEMPHQRERWGAKHDAGKAPADWFWLIGYLAGKALHALTTGDMEKAKHHVITTAAALGNWFLAITGESTAMRPGIDTPKGES